MGGSSGHQGLAWDGAAVVAVEPAHVVSGALLVLLAAEGVASLVHAAALLAQSRRHWPVRHWRATHHATDSRVRAVV